MHQFKPFVWSLYSSDLECTKNAESKTNKKKKKKKKKKTLFITSVKSNLWFSSSQYISVFLSAVNCVVEKYTNKYWSVLKAILTLVMFRIYRK